MFTLGTVGAVNTQIHTDNTLSGITALNINAPGASQMYTLSEINGKLSGHNLFYSFSDFSIGATDTAWFNLNTPELANVISRVTGGIESVINGQLKMANATSGAPSFFFINPAGMTMSAGASVDVPGSFYASTASKLNFSDGSQYAANEASASFLSSANPESFGFLGNEVGSITLSGTETAKTNLNFKPGSDVAFVANQIRIDNAIIGNSNNSAQTGLDLQLITTGEEATNINLNVLPDHATSGDLTLHNASLVVSGNGLGRLIVRSGDFSIKGSTLLATNIGDALMATDQGIDVNVNSLISDSSILGVQTIANGDAGNVKVIVDSLQLINRSSLGSINSKDFSGKSGDVLIKGRQLEIDNAYISNSTNNGKNGGDLIITADSLKIINQGLIVSGALDENSTGNSGNVTIEAQELEVNHSTIGSNTFSRGNGGIVSVTADLLKLDNTGQIMSGTTGEGNSGIIKINAGLLESNNLSSISANTFGKGNAGSVTVIADSIKLNNGGSFSTDTTPTSEGHGGSIEIRTKNLEMNNAFISSRTFGHGNAGNIVVAAESIKLNNDSGFDRGIFSSSGKKVIGDAGSIMVNAKNIDINGAFIGSDTGGIGNAGSVTITSDSLKLINRGSITSAVEETAEGNGGNVTLNIDQLEIENATVTSGTLGNGDAGNVTVNADLIKLHKDGVIASATNTKGNGGAVSINAGQLEVNDGFVDSRTTGDGNAGNLIIVTNFLKLLNNGIINSSSGDKNHTPSGNGGGVSINANQLEISNAYITSESFGSGNAGQLNVNANSIQLHENGFMSTSTFGQGSAGDIKIATKSLTALGTGNPIIDLSSANLTGIFSGADAESGGQTGTIEVNVKNDIQLNNGAQISIKNDATVAESKLNSLTPTAISIDAANLFLTNSRIAADSNGNVGAGSIHIHFANQLFLDPSQITTEATDGNGGAIAIHGDGSIFLLDSAITTSVSGQSGNGGDIVIAAKGLILDSGFIQANTAASGASGGNVNIKTSALIPSASSLFVGGNIPFQFQPFSGLNVIQAAAPGGESGAISSATPQLNLSGMMTNLVVQSFDSNALNRNMCTVDEGSFLLQSGKGGLRMRARDFLLSPMY
jgi:filamentous hemagglutinin family protein